MQFEDTFKYIGEIGLYQVLLFSLAGLSEFLGPEAIGMNFVGYRQEHWCRVEALQDLSHRQQRNIAIPYGKNGKYRRCEMFPFNYSSFSREELLSWNRTAMTQNFTKSDFVGCKAWNYDQSIMLSTITSRWDLVCDRSTLVQLVSSIYMLGRLIASFVAGAVSDKIGRKKAILIFLAIKCVGVFMSTFGPHYAVFVVGRFLLALGTTGSKLCAYVLTMEVMGKRWRSIFGVIWQFNWGIGYMLFSVQGFFIRDYIKYQMATSFPVFLLFAYILVLDESPRWLISMGRQEEGLRLLRKIAKINGSSVPDGIKVEVQREKKPEKEATYLDLFKTANLRKKTIVIHLIWLTNSLVYYGLSLNAGLLSGDIFLNTFISGAVEIPANVVTVTIVNLLGRKPAQMFGLALAAVSSWINIPLILNRGTGRAVTAMSMVGKAGVTMSVASAYLFSVELFPTEVRNVGIGASSMIGRVGAIAAPFAGGPLADVWAPMPPLLFGTMATLSCALCLLLPETRNQKLPETIEEAERFGKRNSKDKEKRGIDNPQKVSEDSTQL